MQKTEMSEIEILLLNFYENVLLESRGWNIGIYFQ